jgi:hypothetical protein
VWVLFSELAENKARLVSLNLKDGQRRCLAEASAGIPMIGAFESGSRSLAYIHDDGGDARLIWCHQPTFAPVDITHFIQGRPVRLALSRCGRRVVVESILLSGITAVYLLVVSDDGLERSLLSSLMLPDGRSLRRPVFFGRPDRVFCYVTSPDGQVDAATIDFGRPGESAFIAPGARAAGRLIEWGSNHPIVIDGPRVALPESNAVIVTGVSGDTERQQLMRLTADGTAPTYLGEQHSQVDALPNVVNERSVMYGADGHLWVVTPDGTRALTGGANHLHVTGIQRDSAGDRYVYGYNEAGGIQIAWTSAKRISSKGGWRIDGAQLMSVFCLIYDKAVLDLEAYPTLAPASQYSTSQRVDGRETTEPLPSERALLAPTGVLSIPPQTTAPVEFDRTMAASEPADDPMFGSHGDLTETEVGGQAVFDLLVGTGELPDADVPRPATRALGSLNTPGTPDDEGVEPPHTMELNTTECDGGVTQVVETINLPDEAPKEVKTKNTEVSKNTAVLAPDVLTEDMSGRPDEQTSGLLSTRGALKTAPLREREDSTTSEVDAVWEGAAGGEHLDSESDSHESKAVAVANPASDTPSSSSGSGDLEASMPATDEFEVSDEFTALNEDLEPGDLATESIVAQPEMVTSDPDSDRLEPGSVDHSEDQDRSLDESLPATDVLDRPETPTPDLDMGDGDVVSYGEEDKVEGTPSQGDASLPGATLDADEDVPMSVFDGSDEGDDVWTSAPAAIAAPKPDPEPVRDVVLQAQERLPRRVKESELIPQSAPTLPDGTPRPDIDFDGWFDRVCGLEDPIPELQALERYSGDTAVGMAAMHRLEQQIQVLKEDPDSLSDLIFCIAAIAHVRARAARERLVKYCHLAYDRLLKDGSLPEVEEHFAMAAVRALDNPKGRFETMAVYREYESVVTAMSDALASGGEESAGRRMRNLGRRYRRALEMLVKPGRSDEKRRKEPATSSTSPKKPARTKKSGGAKIDLMEGYEFPSVDDFPGVDELPNVDEVSPSAGAFVDKFQPFMASFSSGSPSRSVVDRPSIDAFKVSAFDSDEEEHFEEDWTPTESQGGPTVILGLLAVVGGLALAILGYRLSVGHAAAGCLWTIGGIALIGGRPTGIKLGGFAYGVCGLTLIYTGLLMTLPAWLRSSGATIGGLVAFVIAIFIFLRLIPTKASSRLS